MKKSAIALAVAAALAASAVAQAETTFYGRLGFALNYLDVTDDNTLLSNDGVWDISEHSGRWGVKGSEDLGNGLSAIYNLESAIASDTHDGNVDSFKGRLAWSGLKGGFGAITMGAQWSPYYNVAGRTDVFNASFYNKYSGVFRVNNSLVYATPDSISFMKGEVMAVFDGGSGEDGVDQWNVGANFTLGPAGFGFAYLSDEVTNDDQFVVTAGGGFGPVNVAALYEHINPDAATENDEDNIHVVAQYVFGNNDIKAGWARNDPDNGQELDEFAVGFQHNLSNRTRVWVEYNQIDLSDNSDSDKVSLGFRHDF